MTDVVSIEEGRRRALEAIARRSSTSPSGERGSMDCLMKVFRIWIDAILNACRCRPPKAGFR